MLEYFALFLVFFVIIVLFYGVIVIHDIPYEIAEKRGHPHQDAIHVAGWVSLFTLHVIWPFLWIWATLYRQDRGWGFTHNSQNDTGNQDNVALREEVAELKQQVRILQESMSDHKLLNEEN